jgi:DNA-binding response OmpR family regulator
MRILLAEDEPDIGNALQQMLTREGHVTDWAIDGNQAWEYLRSDVVQYELAILDWMMPGLSGIELCQKIQQSNCAARILMLTAKDTIENRVQGLDAGADDYLVKPFRMPELLARIRSIQRRLDNQIPPNNLRIGNLVLDQDSLTIYSVLNHHQLVSLHAKDLQLLEYLMHHANIIVTYDQIAEMLWLAQDAVTHNAITVRVKILRQKLTEIGFAEAIENVYGLGYRLVSTALDR